MRRRRRRRKEEEEWQWLLIKNQCVSHALFVHR